jgi:hypothetical protein
MLDQAHISRMLEALEIPIAGAIIEPSAAGENFFVFVAVTRDSENRQVPSNRKLHEARQALSVLGATVEFLLTDAQTQDIEAGLRATLLHSFGEDVRNIFLSTENNVAHAWVDPKRALDSAAIAAMQEKARIFLKEFDIPLGSLNTTTGETLPSALACLRVMRQLAPVTASALKDELMRRGFTVPSADWLARRLDALRRGGKIVRLEPGQYALSLRALQELGTIKGRSSPDIARLLALARARR